MDNPNPYAAPSSVAAPHDPRDSVDLYRATLPTPAVHTTGITALISGIAMVVIDARLVAGVAYATPVVLAVLVAFAFASAGFFATAWGVREGRLWSLVLGFAACAIAGLASLVVLMSGLGAGALGGALAVFTAVMLVTSAKAVRSMAQARAALAKLERAEKQAQPA